MAANTNPVFQLQPVIMTASLVSPTAVTSRADITGTTNLTEVASSDTTYTDGRKIDRVEIKAKETTVAGIVALWIYDGTTSRLFDEFLVSALTPGNTTPSWSTGKSYDHLVLPSGHKLYCSVTVDQDFDVFAFAGDY